MIFAQYNYKEYHNNNTELHPIQPYHWDNWIKMVNGNQYYCHKFNFIKWCAFYFWLFVGRIKKSELPSFHPFWKKIKKIKIKNPNMTHIFLLRGFTPTMKIKPYENWFGLSVYHPYCKFVRGNKEVTMVLQRDIFKFIIFTEDGIVKYETNEGQLPSEKFIKHFTKKRWHGNLL